MNVHFRLSFFLEKRNKVIWTEKIENEIVFECFLYFYSRISNASLRDVEESKHPSLVKNPNVPTLRFHF